MHKLVKFTNSSLGYVLNRSHVECGHICIANFTSSANDLNILMPLLYYMFMSINKVKEKKERIRHSLYHQPDKCVVRGSGRIKI